MLLLLWRKWSASYLTMPVDILRSRYRAHKGNAKKRGIAFEFTFEEWVKIWIDSGHLRERGQRRGCYVMARFWDKGPYAVGNVKIILAEENGREYMSWAKSRLLEINKGNQYVLGMRHTDESKAKMSAVHIGNTHRRGKTMSAKSRAQTSASLKKHYETARPHNSRLSREDQNMLLQEYLAGVRLRVIADRYGVKPAYVPNLARRRGLPIRRPFKKERAGLCPVG